MMPFLLSPAPPLVIKKLFLWAAVAGAAVLGGCAGRPEAPVLRPLADNTAADTAARIDPLLPTEILLLGEQHDAAQHQQIEQQVIAMLAARGALAGLALEMANAGATTAALKPSSSEQQVKSALKWNDRGWPWETYSPAVMTAVRAGVPVVGANLPGTLLQASMADGKLDMQLPGAALKAQQQLIRIGHCNLLPEGQITPMTRIQVARDISMANTLTQLVLPGKVVVLLSGSGHADRNLGVPQHLPAGISHKSIRLRAGDDIPGASERPDAFDSVWPTPATAEVDYCEKFRVQMRK